MAAGLRGAKSSPVRLRVGAKSAFTLALVLATTSPAIACVPSFVAFEDAGVKLNAIDRASIAAFVHEARTLRHASIELVAQTDGTGAGRVMSWRRASGVRAELVRLGVPADSITIKVAGPANRLITGPGSARFVIMKPGAVRKTGTSEAPNC